MSSQLIPFPLRMPEELRDRLTERARVSGRSLNAEIIGILQSGLSERQYDQTHLDIEVLAESVATKVAAKLSK